MYNSISSFLGFFPLNGVTIDDWVFQLHYKFTTVLLFFISLVITSAKIFSDVINCMSYDGKIPAPVMNSYGWLVANCTSTREDGSQEGKCYWAPLYYVWTPFILLSFGILYYAPRYLWLYLEESTVERLCWSAKSQVIEGGSKEKLQKTLEEMAKYCIDNEKTHEPFAYYYLLCQTMNWLNVSVQFVLINLFPCIACKKMCSFWTEMLQYTREPFPVLMRCSMNSKFYDPRLNQTEFRYAICVVPLNDLHNQIAYLLWTWFFIVMVFSTVALLWNLLQLRSVHVKKWWLRRRVIDIDDTISKIMDHVEKEDVHQWFLLCAVKKNLTRIQFRSFLVLFQNEHPTVSKQSVPPGDSELISDSENQGNENDPLVENGAYICPDLKKCSIS